MSDLSIGAPGLSGLPERALAGADAARLGEARRQMDAGEGEAAARSFEHVLATMLVRELRSALPDGFFGGGSGAGVYEAWLDEHLGRSLVEDGGLGIAGMVQEWAVRSGSTSDEPEEPEGIELPERTGEQADEVTA